MIIKKLSSDAKIVPLLQPLAADAESTRVTPVLDTSGFTSLLLLVYFGTIEAEAATSLSLAHADAASDANTLTSGAAVEGSSQTIADDDDGTLRYIEVVPTKRFYQLTVTKDGEETSNEAVVAVLYGSDKKPVAQPDTVEGENLGDAETGDA